MKLFETTSMLISKILWDFLAIPNWLFLNIQLYTDELYRQNLPTDIYLALSLGTE